jgi:hypothetical protein
MHCSWRINDTVALKKLSFEVFITGNSETLAKIFLVNMYLFKRHSKNLFCFKIKSHMIRRIEKGKCTDFINFFPSYCCCLNFRYVVWFSLFFFKAAESKQCLLFTLRPVYFYFSIINITLQVCYMFILKFWRKLNVSLSVVLLYCTYSFVVQY